MLVELGIARVCSWFICSIHNTMSSNIQNYIGIGRKGSHLHAFPQKCWYRLDLNRADHSVSRQNRLHLTWTISNPVFNFCLPIYCLNLHWNYLLSVPVSSENCSFILFNWTLFRQFLFECFFLYLTRVSINTSKVRRVLERWLTESSLFL